MTERGVCICLECGCQFSDDAKVHLEREARKPVRHPWLLGHAEMHLADLHYEDNKWVSGWRSGVPPSRIAEMKRRIARAEKWVRWLGGTP